MTRLAVAAATDRELEFHPELFEDIAQRFRQFGARMSDNNRVQAYLPSESIPVHNRLGTAPCFIVEAGQGTVISLPGVPREMKDIMAATVIPYLRDRMGGVGIIKARVLRTAGIGESQIDARIGDLETWSNPTVGLAAHTGQTDIRITARADTEIEADEMIAKAETIIRERLGSFIYGVDKEPLEDVFMRLLCEHKLTLAVSFTGPEGLTMVERLRRQAGSGDV
jgi:nicotinamide-nucleotide amidase